MLSVKMSDNLNLELELVYECEKCRSILKTDHPSKACRCSICQYNKLTLLQIINGDETLARMKLADCYDKIIGLAKVYLDMPQDYYHVLATWVIGTYFHESFQAFPYLFFNAMRGSGKTRTLKFISALGNKGDGSVQNNLTEAVLFRIPRGTTTCLDEVEQIGSKEKQTLRELLNSAYKKGMKVKRMKKQKVNGTEQQVVETFEPYYPLAMANIWGMDEVLSDRAITLILEKSDNPSITKMIEDFDNPYFLEIKRTLEQFSVVSAVYICKKNIYREWNNYVVDKYTTTLHTYNTLTTQTTQTTKEKIEHIDLEMMFNKIDALGITGRNFELLLPLLIVNLNLSQEHFDNFLKIGMNLVNKKKEDEYGDSKDVLVYDFIGRWMSPDKEYHSIKAMTQEFRMFCGETEQEDKWLNDKWFGRALKRLNLIKDKRRVSSGMEVTLDYDKAKEKLKIFRGTDE